jgi:type IV pilus assembly protein PilV
MLELLAAMVIMMVGLLGLLQTVNVALLHNMANQLRGDAVLVADEQMALEMTKPFDLISTNTTPHVDVVRRDILNTFKNYSVTRVGANVSGNTKSVAMTVRWHHKGQTYTHNISSMISKFNQ